MSGDLLATVLANTVIAGLLGVAALAVWRWRRHAAWSHALLLLALAKLVTPAFVQFELPFVPTDAASEPVEYVLVPVATGPLPDLGAHAGFAGSAAPLPIAPVAPVDDGAAASFAPFVEFAGIAALVVWIVGAGVVAFIALRRARRFARLIRHAEVADFDVLTIAAQLAKQLGLRRIPDVRIVDARLGPLVFRFGRRAIVVLPRVCLDALDARELRAVLAHELSHVANRDHLTRWLETVVAIVHWWNPIASWLRSRLRESEELRCDARAVAVLSSGARHYGRTILKTVSYVDGDVAGIPLAASGLGSPASLKMRLQMIAQSKTEHRLSLIGRSALALGAVALLPLGLSAQEQNPTKDRAAKIEQIRQLLRELREETQGKGSTAETVEVEVAKPHVIRVEGGDGAKAGLFVKKVESVESDEAKSEAAEGSKPAKKALRWFAQNQDGEGQKAVIEVDGERIELPHGGAWKAITGKDGEFKFDGFELPEGAFKVFGGGQPFVFHVDTDDEDAKEQTHKVIVKRVNGGDVEAHAFVIPDGAGVHGELPEHVKKLLEAHGGKARAVVIDGEQNPTLRIHELLKKAEQADGDHGAMHKRLLDILHERQDNAAKGDGEQQHAIVIRSRKADADDDEDDDDVDHAEAHTVQGHDVFEWHAGGQLKGKVVGPDGAPIEIAEIKVVGPDGNPFDASKGGAWVMRGGEPAKLLRVQKSEETKKKNADADDDAAIEAQIKKLEAQLEAIEKKLDKLRSRQV